MSRQFLSCLLVAGLLAGCGTDGREIFDLLPDAAPVIVLPDGRVADVSDAATTPSVDASSTNMEDAAVLPGEPDAPPVADLPDAPVVAPLPDGPPVVEPPVPDAPGETKADAPPVIVPLPDGPPIVVPPPPPDAPVIVPLPDGPTTGGGVPDAPIVVVPVPDAPPVVVPVPDAPPVVVPVPDAPPPPAVLTYTTADGLANPIIDVTTDQGGNLWAISPDHLFLLTPGAPSFVAFDNTDGLHVEPFTAPDGSAQITRLTAIGGAEPNRLYLGYFGYESDDPFNDTDAQKRLGNGDRVDYDPATGAIAVHRYEFKCVVESSRCWEDRSVRRIVVGKTGVAQNHAFFGFNHGTTHVWQDILGDHVHPQVIWHNGAETVTRYGENQALALNDDGTLWIGNRCGVGLMNWAADPIAWTTAKFKTAFTTYTDDHALDVPFGYNEDNRGAAIGPDGTLWLASDNRGLTSWLPNSPANYTNMVHWTQTPGLPTANFTDVAADVDGTVWLVVADGTLLHFDPATSTFMPTNIGDARRLFLDKTVTPRALYVARFIGVTVLR